VAKAALACVRVCVCVCACVCAYSAMLYSKTARPNQLGSYDPGSVRLSSLGGQGCRLEIVGKYERTVDDCDGCRWERDRYVENKGDR
jgi:hypothetical protein